MSLTPALGGSTRRSRRLDTGDVPSVIGDEMPLAVVEDHEVVVPWVCHDCAPTDRDVEGLDDDTATCGDESLDRRRDLGNGEISLRAGSFRLQDELCLRFRQSHPHAGDRSPNHLMPEASVKGDRAVEIGHPQRETVDLSKERLLCHDQTLRHRHALCDAAVALAHRRRLSDPSVMPVTGTLIAESLRVGAQIEGMPLTATKIERATVGDVAVGQPATWTFIEFEAREEDAQRLAHALEAALLQDGGWYCDFRSDDETYVVFAGRTFQYPRGDDRGRADAVEYGRSVGVPDPQLDWPV